MENSKKKIVLGLSATLLLVLSGCGSKTESGKSSVAPSRRSIAQESSSVYISPVTHTVTFKEEGKADVVQTVHEGQPATKPATDPVAPNGKKFYGWMQKDWGGKIWNFDKPALNKVMVDTVLEPLFVDNVGTQLLEAELCRCITDGEGMDGSTYSGGAKGNQLVYHDYDQLYDCTSYTGSFEYYKGVKNVYMPWEEDIPTSAQKATASNDVGCFVHFMYNPNTGLKFDIELDHAIANATMFGRYSGEYGIKRTYTDTSVEVLQFSFTDEEFVIEVNGEPLKYGEVTITNLVDMSYIPFQDFLITTSLNLRQGKNTIELKVANTKSLNGTIACTAPVIDSLKIITNETINWPTAKLTNLLGANK